MKRLRIILLFLLLGAVVNVAVAWGSVLLIDVFNGQYDDFEIQVGRSRIGAVRYDHIACTYIELQVSAWPEDTKAHLASVLDGRFSADSVYNFPRNHDPLGFFPQWASRYYEREPDVTVMEGRGWPRRSLVHGYKIFEMSTYPRRKVSITPLGSVKLPIADRGWLGGDMLPVRLPLQPDWPGFIFNTLYHAVLSWLLFNGLLASRGMIRRKRGHCVKCAYDLRGVEHEACPECGTEVMKA